MNNNLSELEALLDHVFKFKVTDVVKLKVDVYSFSETTLFILSRIISETVEDGKTVHQKHYSCRVSSTIVESFKEGELLSEEEFMNLRMEFEMKRNKLKSDIGQNQEEIFREFGVAHYSSLYLKDSEGNPILDKKYRPIGYTSNLETQEFELVIRETGGLNIYKEERPVKMGEFINIDEYNKKRYSDEIDGGLTKSEVSMGPGNYRGEDMVEPEINHA